MIKKIFIICVLLIGRLAFADEAPRYTELSRELKIIFSSVEYANALQMVHREVPFQSNVDIAIKTISTTEDKWTPHVVIQLEKIQVFNGRNDSITVERTDHGQILANLALTRAGQLRIEDLHYAPLAEPSSPDKDGR